ncbi:MAG TPA: putative toxin-antitoxin system toxin component, PIN family [Burkholderiales bacterium]|jgi:putative PIN family toxin of toxin-antitoxin system|nr:putative toxin-antitoxin system toxin component, PIN family [Burkholderiales bacterium]
MAGVAGLAAGGGVAAPAWRLVLDTNVWLDWLVFDEPTLAPLRAAHAAGRVEIVMDEACEAELARVLAYDLGKHTIGAEAQASCIERCRSLAKRLDANAVDFAAPPATATGALPRCSDPDDQKFLELALAAQADVLVTKDRALLDLARRGLPFRIAAPQTLREI